MMRSFTNILPPEPIRFRLNLFLYMLIFACFLLAGTAFAQSEELEPTPLNPSPRAFSLGSGVGFAKMDEDYFFRIRPTFEASVPDLTLFKDAPRLGGEVEGELRVKLSAPFNIRMVDRGSNNPTFRNADWDEISEYLAILQRFEYATPTSPMYWRVGSQANATIGHGTVLENHMNTADMDHRRFGVLFGMHALRGGLEFYIDDLIRPFTIGGRVYVRPWGTKVDKPTLSGLAFGFKAIADPSSPLRMTRVTQGGQEQFTLERERYLDVERAEPLAILGFDFEVPFARFGDTRWTAFTDINLNPGAGLGWHIGTNIGWKPSPAWVLDIDLEYQLLHEEYLARYFSWTYQATRFRPQQQSLQPITDSTGSGANFRVAVRHRDVGSISIGTNQDFRSLAAGDTFSIRVQSPRDRRFRLAAAYAMVRMDNFKGANWWKDAWFQLEASYTFLPWLSATASIGRRYRTQEDQLASTSTRDAYHPVDDIYLGVRFHKRWNKYPEVPEPVGY